MEVVALESRVHLVEDVVALLERTWPEWYGPAGPGDAVCDARPAAAGDLPARVVAVDDEGHLVGTAALTARSVASHAHLTPWLGSLVVVERARGHGVGTALVGAIEERARELGHDTLHTATATAAGIVTRRGWTLLDGSSPAGGGPSVYVLDLTDHQRGGAPWTS